MPPGTGCHGIRQAGDHHEGRRWPTRSVARAQRRSLTPASVPGGSATARVRPRRPNPKWLRSAASDAAGRRRPRGRTRPGCGRRRCRRAVGRPARRSRSGPRGAGRRPRTRAAPAGGRERRTAWTSEMIRAAVVLSGRRWRAAARRSRRSPRPARSARGSWPREVATWVASWVSTTWAPRRLERHEHLRVDEDVHRRPTRPRPVDRGGHRRDPGVLARVGVQGGVEPLLGRGHLHHQVRRVQSGSTARTWGTAARARAAIRSASAALPWTSTSVPGRTAYLERPGQPQRASAGLPRRRRRCARSPVARREPDAHLQRLGRAGRSRRSATRPARTAAKAPSAATPPAWST